MVRENGIELKLGEDWRLFLYACASSAVSAFIFSLFFMEYILLGGGKMEISTELSSKVLTIIVELVGVLFGLSAIMVALFFDALEETTEKLKRRCVFYSATSFVSFIFSLFLSFSYLLLPKVNLWLISWPIGFAIFGVTCATLYMLMAFRLEESKGT